MKVPVRLTTNHKGRPGTGFLPGVPRPALLTVVTHCRYLKGFISG